MLPPLAKLKYRTQSWLDASQQMPLRLQLTLGILAIIVPGMVGYGWLVRRAMAQMMVKSCEQSMELVATQFAKDVQVDNSDLLTPTLLQQTINKWSSDTLWMWIKYPQQGMMAHSVELESIPTSVMSEWVDMELPMAEPQAYYVDNRRLLVMGHTLELQDGTMGQLFLVQDTTEMMMLSDRARYALGLTTLIVLPGLVGVAVMTVRRSLKPIRQLQSLAQAPTATTPPIRPEELPEELRELVLSYNHLCEQVSKTGEWQREFTNQVSHDLRTPLTLVYGYLQSVLRRGDNLTPAQHEALAIAQSEAEYIIHMLQTILNDARAEAIATSSPSSDQPPSHDSNSSHSAH
ncbi:histidine kinase dimerization/phospho-acceptor domain-containing protein [Leptolyngbya sp. AN02str]|uniref:histidine kinase dimerization/phospho-acceptor domain-containing protein n=1 Tax=Leptolyngbya sp. AN02str TaxID=3423363 RepID=UPI003D317662